MCFLKHVKMVNSAPSDSSTHNKSDKIDSDTEIFSQYDLLPNWHSKPQEEYSPEHQRLLMSCLGLMQMNSALLKNMDEKLESTGDILSRSFGFLPQQALRRCPIEPSEEALFRENIPQKVEQLCQGTADTLTQKLFGQQQYRYKLELSRPFPEVLFKERNFELGVKLVDIVSGKEQRNGNLINLSVAVCDSQGEWIHETKEGLPFIKGKVESELYHGEGEFCKLAPRDVSRGFEGKTINFVVYCKPSLLKYSGETTLEENVDHRNVEPLIIRDVTVKAKKRE